MKKYRITVNGTSYEVEVEELGAAYAPTPAAPAPAARPAAPAPKAAPAPAAPAAPAPAAAPSAGASVVAAPMPGNILDIKVKAGDSVKKGDVLLILEAMKMENEIQAAADGVVDAVLTSKGAVVESGAPLISMK